MTSSTSHVAESAHILFIDIVGYSLALHEEQERLLMRLMALVRATPEFQRAEANGDLMALPAGDGMALVFFRYPLAPVQCAVEIARAVASQAGLRLRMGVNSGPVTRITDMRGKENVTGGGINVAQRVMDCGDAGHILLSQSSADMARQFETWRDALHDLGDSTVKHGVVVRLYNLCQQDAGNPALPHRLQNATPNPAPSPLATNAVVAAPNALRAVVLLYKRNAPHSAHLTGLLETALTQAGYAVFIDRHLPVGVEWAKELKRQIQAAYAVVPLLSAESIWSEMVEDEVITAYETAQQHDNLPRLLPVRVAYEGPLPESIDHILSPLQYILWQGPHDDARLTEGLVAALRQETRPSPPPLDPSGGAVPLDSRYYIARRTDTECAEAIARGESTVLVKGARQMGKTSLLARATRHARTTGALCFRTDLQKLPAHLFQSEESFFRMLAEMIADQLDLDTAPEALWNANRGGSYNFERYLRRVALQQSDARVVWALDEADRLFACPFGGDVFALFRSWHNDRAYEPDGPWSKLTLCIAYATEAHLFITDPNQSPFNVGTRLALDDFTPSQVGELNERYNRPLKEAEVSRFHALLGGQPYLSRRGLDHLVHQGGTLEALEAEASLDEGPFGDHLRRLLVMLSQDAETLEVARRLLKGEPPPNSATFYRLRSGGLLAGASPEEARMRCRLYTLYLSRHL